MADQYHRFAPDYPVWSQLDASLESFLTFDNLRRSIDESPRLRMNKLRPSYVQDSGAPSARLAGLSIRSGCYRMWPPERKRLRRGMDKQVLAAIRRLEEPQSKEKRGRHCGSLLTRQPSGVHAWREESLKLVSPDGAAHDRSLDRRGTTRSSSHTVHEYGSNRPLYPKWQEYFRKPSRRCGSHGARTDQNLPPAGAEPYMSATCKTLEIT